jgi:hypothetical protein
MFPRVALLACAVILATCIPAALAQDPPAADATQTREDILKQDGQKITFYAHIFAHDRNSPMPMNTQFPSGEQDYSIGQALGCGNPPPLPANDECMTTDYNSQFWYTTAGFVQVKSLEEFTGYDLFHNERGMTKDVYVDTALNPVSTYYMSADFHGWVTTLCVTLCWNWDPGMFQDWVVESWMWHAPTGALHMNASEEPDMTAVDQRTADAVLMAHCKTEPIDMVSLDPTVPTGEKTVWPFPCEMTWDEAFKATDGKVPLTSNLIMEYRWYQETANPTGGTNKYIPGAGAPVPNFNVNSGEDYPANVVIPVRNPIDVELVYPQFIHNKLVILSVINTPWGSYDIDPALITLTIQDKSGNVITPAPGTLQQVLEQSVAHSGHYQPIKPTWVWDYQAQGLAPGDYSVTVGVTNFQHSVKTETTALFAVNKDGSGETQEGRRGIQTLQGNLHAGHEGTAADPNATAAAPTDDAPSTTTEKSPGMGLPLLGAALAAAVIVIRRKSA